MTDELYTNPRCNLLKNKLIEVISFTNPFGPNISITPRSSNLYVLIRLKFKIVWTINSL